MNVINEWVQSKIVFKKSARPDECDDSIEIDAGRKIVSSPKYVSSDLIGWLLKLSKVLNVSKINYDDYLRKLSFIVFIDFTLTEASDM